MSRNVVVFDPRNFLVALEFTRSLRELHITPAEIC